MLRKIQILALVVPTLGLTAFAGTPNSIGTVSTRGEMRVDSYAVSGNATLFNGTVVETEQTAAEFRLGKGVNVMLSTASSGTLFGDHMVLNRGAAKLSGAGAFEVRASGLHVTPLGPGSAGMVAVLDGNMVKVSSVTGEFAVTGADGATLANLHPGETRVFSAMQTGDQNNNTNQKVKGAGWSEKTVSEVILFEIGAGLGVGIGLGVAASR